MNTLLFIAASAFGSGLSPLPADETPCDNIYMPYKTGMQLEYTNYDKKGKVTSTEEMTVKNATSVDGAFTVTIHQISKDEKGKNPAETDFTFTCTGDGIHIDMNFMVDDEMTKAMEGMEMEIEQSEMMIPNELSAGQALPDASITIKASTGGVNVMTINLEITDRKVEGFEEVTTPAGTFQTAKLSQTVKSKFGFASKTMNTLEWLGLNVGGVKSETYDKNGKLMGSRELTSVSGN